MIKREIVEKALEKPSPYGPDIDLSKFEMVEPGFDVLDEGKIDDRVANTLSRVSLPHGSVAYLQVDETALYKALEKTLARYNVVIMPLRLALQKYDIAKKISWNLIDPSIDKYTASAYLYGGETGYFIYVPPNTKVPIPVYTCLALVSDKRIQFVHNVVYVDEGSELHLITGCAVPHGVYEGLHIGISEYYVGRNARLTFTMVHAWSKGVHVRPRTSVYVEEGGEYVSYYVIYSQVSSLQTYPAVNLKKGGRAYLASIIAGSGDGVYDVGSKAILREDGSSAEIISRNIAYDSSKIYARSDIEAWEANTRGHIECLGLLLSDNASISSIPVITSRKQGALLSHEAAIGVIAKEELEYLMSKGFTENEARAVIIRGFMSVEPHGIPLNIRREIDRILDLVAKQAVG